MHTLGLTAYLFVMAVLFAIFEIESEGKHGWGEKFPTWYRTSGPVAALYRRVINKPLTGYHAALFPVPILIFLWPMVALSEFTLAGVFGAVAAYLAWVVVWDFAWFVLNPSYGIRNFSPKNIWWFSNEPWLDQRVPVGYISSWATALVFAVLSGLAGNGIDRVYEQLGQFLWYSVFTAVLVLVGAPAYQHYYHRMRRKDERDQAGIFHNL